MVVRFDLPEPEYSFATTWCSRCGSPLPHLTESGKTVQVPAGSLDTEPSSRPQCHTFWDFWSSWTCGEKELPRTPGDAFEPRL